MVVLNNIDSIIKEIVTRYKFITDVEKLDGITMQCKIKGRKSFEKVKAELTDLCEELELLPISIEMNEEDKTLFALQFPDLNILYEEGDLKRMCGQTYKWLLDNARQKEKMGVGMKTNITRKLLEQGSQVFVKQCIHIYCRNNINPYKENAEKYLNDIEFKNKLLNIYMSYLDTYCLENHIM